MIKNTADTTLNTVQFESICSSKQKTPQQYIYKQIMAPKLKTKCTTHLKKTLYINGGNIKHTIIIVVFKQDVNTVDAAHSTKIQLPPHVFIRAVSTYSLSPHTRRYIPVYRIVSTIKKSCVCV